MISIRCSSSPRSSDRFSFSRDEFELRWEELDTITDTFVVSRVKLMHRKSTGKMSRNIFLLCVVAVLLQWQPWIAVSAHLVPPKGYSVGFTATIAKGTAKYVCNQGTWTKSGSSATLSASDGSALGTYGSITHPLTKAVTYYWTLINSPGDYHESGQAKSGLQAIPVKTVPLFTPSTLEYLAIVRVHRGAGLGDQVAFVSLTGTTGGVAPAKNLCTKYGTVASVKFTGTFRFYTQDRQPPAEVPVSLTPVAANFLQVVFLEGKVVYKFARGRWRYFGVFARVWDVAGGTCLGKFGTVNQADKMGSKLFFRFNEPNGFWMWGQNCARPVSVTAEGVPWQLLRITTSGGAVSSLGKYTYALMGATMGGLAPKIASKASGTTWNSAFTAQCYMFTE